MFPVPSVQIGANHTRDRTQMRVNLFPDAPENSHIPARELHSAAARKLP
jgi:hypothetical protein